jgi:hypothetical protein
MAKPREQRKIPPMPIDVVIFAPMMIVADGPIYRAVTQLSAAYWLSACNQLPTDNQAIAALIRLPQGNFTPIASRTMEVFSTIAPILKSAYDEQAASTARRSARAIAAGKGAARAHKAKHALSQQIIQQAKQTTINRSQPARSTPYTANAATDIAARNAISEQITLANARLTETRSA